MSAITPCIIKRISSMTVNEKLDLLSDCIKEASIFISQFEKAMNLGVAPYDIEIIRIQLSQMRRWHRYYSLIQEISELSFQAEDLKLEAAELWKRFDCREEYSERN